MLPQNFDASIAWDALTLEAEEELHDALLNWNDGELVNGEIRLHVGRDRHLSRGDEGGAVTVDPLEFFEWLASEAPLDPKLYDAESTAPGSAWRATLQTLHRLAFDQPAEAQSPSASSNG